VSIEVLVVDDELRVARATADYLNINTSLTVEHTDDERRALDVIQNNPVKVVVLDQRMEGGRNIGTTGTHLFEQIHLADRFVRCIIFSGQSRETDLKRMLDLRVRFLEKSRLENLPALVSEAKMEYLTDIARDQAGQPIRLGLHRNRFTRLRPPSVTFDLIGIQEVSSAQPALERDYVTGRRLDAPGKYKFEEANEKEVEIEREQSYELDTGSSTRASLMFELTASLSLALREQYRETRRQLAKDSTTVELELPTGEGIEAKTYERARLYRRRRAVVRLNCECCDRPEILTFDFREWTGRYHNRRRDTLSDGTTKPVDLGES
jgi:CheY-like chemotaxis protein